MKGLIITVTTIFILSTVPAMAMDYGTGGLVVIVERKAGNVLVIDSTRHRLLKRITGVGNLHHGTVKFSRDMHYAYVITRTAGVVKIDLHTLKIVKKVSAGRDSVGGVMTQDGRYIALSNYEPGEVKILDAETLKVVKSIKAHSKDTVGRPIESRVVGLVDAPSGRLVFSLMDGREIWVVDATKRDFPVVKKYRNIGGFPYDALITPDGRYYIAGLLGTNKVAVVDMWKEKIRLVSLHEEENKEEAPLWKIPHLKGWAITGRYAILPDVQRKWAVVLDLEEFRVVKHIPLNGTALYTVVQPGGRYVWVDLVGENGDMIDIIDVEKLEVVKTLTPGRGATHPQFTPKGEYAYISLMKGGKVVVYDTNTFKKIKEFPADHPSGIFFTYRAYRFGM